MMVVGAVRQCSDCGTSFFRLLRGSLKLVELSVKIVGCNTGFVFYSL